MRYLYLGLFLLSISIFNNVNLFMSSTFSLFNKKIYIDSHNNSLLKDNLIDKGVVITDNYKDSDLVLVMEEVSDKDIEFIIMDKNKLKINYNKDSFDDAVVKIIINNISRYLN